MKLLLWGAGGHGKVVADIARATARFTGIAFIDDGWTDGWVEWAGCPVLGGASRVSDAQRQGYTHFAVSIGGNRARAEAFGRLAAAGLEPAVLVHPMASVAPSARIEAGSVVMPGAVANASASAAANAILNSGCIVEHDVRLGAHVHVAPGAVLGGGVEVAALALVGLGATVLPGIAVGVGSIVGAGAVVRRHVPHGVTVAGVPARIIARTGV